MTDRSGADSPNSATEWEKVPTISDDNDEWIDLFNDGAFLRRVIQKGDDLAGFEMTNSNEGSSGTSAATVTETNNGAAPIGGNNKPNLGDRVKIKTSGLVVGQNKNLPKIDEFDELEFVVGLSDVLQVFELAVQFMTLNEIDEVKVKSRFAYGEMGRIPDVPENATIVYTIHLLSVQPGPDIYNMGIEERVAYCTARKDRGNYFFKRQEFDRSADVYKRGIQATDVILDAELQDAQLKKFHNVRVALYNNLSAACLKLEDYDGAIDSSTKCLHIAPNNLKALFRKAKSHFAKGDFEEALLLYTTLLNLGHSIDEVKDEIVKCKQAIKHEKQRMKKLYERMLGDSLGGKKSRSFLTMKRMGWAALIGAAALGAALALRFINTR